MHSQPPGGLTLTAIATSDIRPDSVDFVHVLNSLDEADPQLHGGIDLRLHNTRTTAQEIRLAIDGQVLGPAQRYVDANGLDVLRWRFPNPIALSESRLTMLDHHVGEPLLIASATLISSADAAVRPPAVSRAIRNERRRATIGDLRSSIETRAIQSPADRAARLFFLDLNCETNPAIMPAMLPAPLVTERTGAIDRTMAALCCRLARRRYGGVGADRADVPPLEALTTVDEVFVELLRRRFPGGLDGVDVDAVLTAFERFAAGHWSNSGHAAGFPLSNGVPNSALIFLFAEFADVARSASPAHRELWNALFAVFVATLGVYLAACTPSRRAFGSYDLKCFRGISSQDLASLPRGLPRASTVVQTLNELVKGAFKDGWR